MSANQETQKLLPWYINQTLASNEIEEVENWLFLSKELNQETLQIYQQIALGLTKQVEFQPSLKIKDTVLSRISRAGFGFILARWAIGIGLVITIFIGLIFTFRPGIELQWTVLGNDLSGFEIYRASQGSESFEFIHELSKDPNSNRYQYLDPLFFPGQTVRYEIVAVDISGLPIYRQTLLSKTTHVFASQIALLLTSIILSFGVLTISQEWRYNQNAIEGYS
jgi:hypothetical protein